MSSSTPTRVYAAIVPQKTIIVDQNLATLAQETEPDVTALVCQSLIYGIYCSIALPTLLTLINKRPRTKPWFFLFTSTILMFVLSTICLVLEVVNTMGVLQGIRLETEGAFQPPTAWYGFRGANNRTLAQAIIFSFQFMLGDAIVIWRAGALWEFVPQVMIPMLVVLLGDFATTLYFIGCEGKGDWWYIAGTQPKSCNVSQRGMFFLSFGTNVVATSFIAVKAWQHRQAFVAMPDSLTSSGSWRRRRSPAQKIMLLFLESGFVYMLFWAACSFTYFPFVLGLESSGFFMTEIFNTIRYQVVGLYPTAIILLVHRESTSWDTPEVAASFLATSSFRAAPGPSPTFKRFGRQHTLDTVGTVESTGDVIGELAQVESRDATDTNPTNGSYYSELKYSEIDGVIDGKRTSGVPGFTPMNVGHDRSPSDGPSIKSEETIVVYSKVE